VRCYSSKVDTELPGN